MSATAVLNIDTLNFEHIDEYKPLKDFIEEKIPTYNDNTLNEGYSIKVKQSQVREYSLLSPIIKNLEEKIATISIPQKWILENVDEPNYLCRQKAIDVVKDIFSNNEIIPDRIGASIEGGIMLHYINYINNKTLSIEIDNDLEIAAVVNQYKTILLSTDIFNMNFMDVIRAYAS